MLGATPQATATNLSQGLTLMIVGMAVVFVALLLLWAVITAVHALGSTRDAGNQTRSTPQSITPASGPPAHDLVTPRLVAVLAAAATVAASGPVRLTRVTPLRRGSADPWSRSGRRGVMGSHRTRSARPKRH
ncbi:MAG: OadG family protein [Planctomycetota bacterium]